MSDQQITCAECSNIFVFSAAEQQFYSERGLASPPKRCKACRQARRASQGGDSGGGGGGGGGGAWGGRGARGPSRDRGPRSTGNPSEYRSPMSNGNGYGGGGGANSRFAPRPSWGGGGQGAPSAARGNGPAPRGDRGPRGNPPARLDQAGGFNAPRSAPAGRDGGQAGQSSWGTRPHEGGQRPPRGPRGDRPPPPPRETKPNERPPGTRPERPKYDITCAECGTKAQVPFKPLEGRQVFCQPCYRARKGTPAPQEATATDDNDTGIVE